MVLLIDGGSNTKYITNMEKHFIYEDTEVILTGRVATRSKSLRTRRDVDSSGTKHEITPANQDCGSWKKWVQMNDLFIITDESNNDD